MTTPHPFNRSTVKRFNRFTALPLCLALGLIASFTALPTQAADYAVQKTFWSFAGTWTNTVGAVTNLNAAIDCTQVGDFALQVVAKGTNNQGTAGSFSIAWETSLDGNNWPGATNIDNRTLGWFAFPQQSNNVTTVWVTNITVDSIGYWRIRHLTNGTGMNFTNIAIRGYVKPKRTNRDY